ncbi:MAG: type I restriction-modification system subunit M N-terminal domain-containing protein, partial [Lachnospiraceae bacterium]|nr:type I restriction-modification system subunit M N-terminal domain-containing protein [Lachnospiraceae bacterium]
MITGEIRNKIDSLWDAFAAGGIVNPLEVVEQITYLMFIKDLDDIDIKGQKEDSMLGIKHTTIFKDVVDINERKVEGKILRWSNFKHFEAKEMYKTISEYVFPFIKNLDSGKESAYSKYMGDAMFKLPTAQLLQKVVSSLDEIYDLMNDMESVDVRGDVYEYLLSKISQSGLNG